MALTTIVAIKKNELNSVVYREVYKCINSFVADDSILGVFEKGKIVSRVYPLILDDLSSLASRDPAAKGSCEYVFRAYSCFKAVMYYRIANALYYHPSNSENREVMILQQIARKISEEAKIKTGVEIHPGAKIGPRFVIDHGSGTVIGETCEIGQDCYLLQGVILGASGIAGNSEGKRHPTLGDRVQVGAFTKILGAVTVGNDVKFSPGCIVNKDIPSNTRIIVTNEYQILKSDECEELELYGIIPQRTEEICIFGKGLSNISVSLVDNNHNDVTWVKFQILEKNDEEIRCALNLSEELETVTTELRLVFKKRDDRFIIAVNSLALKRLLHSRTRAYRQTEQ